MDRSRLPKLKCEGTSKLHEFVDIGQPYVISTRRAACHRCDACWRFERHNCENQTYVGPPVELTVTRENQPSGAMDRINRATLNRGALVRAKEATFESVVCIETHTSEQTFPWVIGSVVTELQSAPSTSLAYDLKKDAVHFDPVRFSEPALQVCIDA